MRRVSIGTVVIFVIFLLLILLSLVKDARCQEKKRISISPDELNVSMMSKVDAHTARWAFECVNRRSSISGINSYKTMLLCGAKFAQTVEKYDVKYKTVLGMKSENLAKWIVKMYLFKSYLDPQYRYAMSVFDYVRSKCEKKSEVGSRAFENCLQREEPRERMEDVHHMVKKYLKPLDLYKSGELSIYNPGFVIIFDH